MYIKRLRYAVLPLLLSATFSSAIASDTLFRPRATFGFASYELTLLRPGSLPTAEISYAMGGFGATIAQDQLYFDFAYNTSLGATYDNGGFDDEFVRTDLNLTVGIALDGGMTLFGGYKTGESTYACTGCIATLYSFKSSGLFFGAGISNSIDDSSSISVNAALALLSGQLKDKEIDLGFIPYNAEADTIGISLGASYNYHISNDSGIGLKATIQNYTFVDWVDPNYVHDDISESIFATEVSYYINF